MDFTFIDNSKEVLKELEDRLPPALEECGLAAEGYAKRLCPVDTGLLRNSITHAVSGQPTAITSYKSNNKHAVTEVTIRNGTAGKPVQVKTGEYNNNAPNAKDHEITVYLGTNVEYAPYVEMETIKHPVPQPFIKPAVTDHQEDYKKIIKRWLEG